MAKMHLATFSNTLMFQEFIKLKQTEYLAREARNNSDKTKHSVKPFEINNSFKTYNNCAHPSGVFTAVFGRNASLLNYGILFFFPDNLVSNADECVRLVPPVNWLLLAKHGEIEVEDLRPAISRALQRSLKEFSNSLLHCMEQGYLRIYLDEYYIPGTGHYRKVHYKHETLVCGFAWEENKVVIVAWDKSGEFSFLRVPFALFILSVTSEMGWPIEWGYRGRFDQDGHYSDTFRKQVLRIQPRPGCVARLNVEVIRGQVQDALASRCTYEKYIGDPMTDWHEDIGRYGMAAYDAYIEYVDQCASGNHRIDMRISRLFWEHKTIMTERLAILRNEGFSIPLQVDIGFEKLAFIARKLHLSLYSNSKNGTSPDTALLKREIKRLAQLEKDALESLISIL